MKTQQNELQGFSTETSATENSLSIYCDKKAESEDVASAFMKLAYAYPNISKLSDNQQAGYMKVFDEAVKYARLTKQQLYDSVMNCICHKHQYGELQISDIIDYDVRVKLYTYGWAVGRQGFVRSNLKRVVGDTWEYWWCRAQDLEHVNRIAEIKNK